MQKSKLTNHTDELEEVMATTATLAQQTLDQLYASEDPLQFVNNVYPLTAKAENDIFNYWWIAHYVDVKIDAYERTHHQSDLDRAQQLYHYNKTRNHGTLIHEYYDDMLWNALAAVRLFHHTKESEYLADAKAVYQDLVDTGWNEITGGGFAWKKTQMSYKNTPVNAPFVILALKLNQIEPEEGYVKQAERTMNWMFETLVDPIDFFIEDGINRQEDMALDTAWQFSYNEGVFIGALVEFYRLTDQMIYLEVAKRCFKATIDRIGDLGVIDDEGDGGDIGLFKGIFYRYSVELFKELASESETLIKPFIEKSIKLMLEHKDDGEKLLIDRNWLKENKLPVFLSDQLSGVMALEAYSKILKSHH